MEISQVVTDMMHPHDTTSTARHFMQTYCKKRMELLRRKSVKLQ
jgi:hypothetical protein